MIGQTPSSARRSMDPQPRSPSPLSRAFRRPVLVGQLVDAAETVGWHRSGRAMVGAVDSPESLIYDLLRSVLSVRCSEEEERL